jgi:hydroxymethylbilane synthase
VKELRIATRRSALALWQAEHVKGLLEAARPGVRVFLVPIVTEGDRIQDRPLAEIGGKGLFVRELEVAIQDGRADLAVHSLKDLPYRLPEGFAIGAVLPRADARDAFVSGRYASLEELPAGERVGTSSLRRQCLLRSLRPDLELVALRGNVDTRLRKLDAGEYGAIVLASAGLMRLGLGARIRAALDPHRFTPSPCQGVIGIECRAGMQAEYAALEHAPTRSLVEAERAFAAGLSADCNAPIAAHAQLRGETLHLRALIGSPDGRIIYRGESEGEMRAAARIGSELAERLLADGAAALLAALRSGTRA